MCFLFYKKTVQTFGQPNNFATFSFVPHFYINLEETKNQGRNGVNMAQKE